MPKHHKHAQKRDINPVPSELEHLQAVKEAENEKKKRLMETMAPAAPLAPHMFEQDDIASFHQERVPETSTPPALSIAHDKEEPNAKEEPTAASFIPSPFAVAFYNPFLTMQIEFMKMVFAMWAPLFSPRL